MPQVCLNCQFVSSLASACSNLKKSRNAGEPEQCGSAQVLSRRVERRKEVLERGSSLWRFLVRFRLEDGTEPELEVREEAYGALKEDACFRITWQADQLKAFSDI